MTNHVCDNTSCDKYLIEMSDARKNDSFIKLPADYSRGQTGVIHLQRYLYRSKGGKTFYLCETCHQAVVMVPG